MKDAELKAYALGYYDGLEHGTEANIFINDTLRHLYRRGYDAGVADYDQKAQLIAERYGAHE